jgi:hypothetical protein
MGLADTVSSYNMGSADYTASVNYTASTVFFLGLMIASVAGIASTIY